ncbi:hypothetical protein D3C80_1661740 [compost metagenome]
MNWKPIALPEPVGQRRVDPIKYLDSDGVLCLKVRCEPKQRLVVENPITEVADLVESSGDVAPLPQCLRAMSKNQTQILPEG